MITDRPMIRWLGEGWLNAYFGTFYKEDKIVLLIPIETLNSLTDWRHYSLVRKQLGFLLSVEPLTLMSMLMLLDPSVLCRTILMAF